MVRAFTVGEGIFTRSLQRYNGIAPVQTPHTHHCGARDDRVLATSDWVHLKNLDEEEVGNQPYFITKFLKTAEDGRSALESLEESICLLTGPRVGKVELIMLRLGLKKVVLVARIAAFNFFHGMIQLTDRCVMGSVSRIFYASMSQDQVRENVAQVTENVLAATGGCVSVKFVAWDGAHEQLRVDAAHFKAVAAKNFAQATNTSVDGSSDTANAHRVVKHSEFIMASTRFESSSGMVAGVDQLL
jgi:hypothetical protein